MAELPESLKNVLRTKLADARKTSPPAYTPRDIAGTVRFPGKATAVIGMRRAGKTTYLHQLRDERLRDGADLVDLPYINFEDERLEGLEGRHLGFLLDEYARRVSAERRRGRVSWFLDEVQTVPGWERFVRRLLDDGECDVTVTGSSAALLSREVATTLRGRSWEVTIFPFSFPESLRHGGIDVPADPSGLDSEVRGRIEGRFLRWLKTGGFPEAQDLDNENRFRLLGDYVDGVVLRDVIERHGVSQPAALRWLVRHLLGNAAAPFSIAKFHAALRSQGIPVAKDTLHNLLAHLEDAFLVRTVWMEAASERQRMVNPRKAYPIDPGLIPLYDRTDRENLGHALETAVLIELERRRYGVTYVRTTGGYEVDFLARKPGERDLLIQVCADAGHPDVAGREIRALDDGALRHSGARRLLLTATRDGIPGDLPEGIESMPAYEWMLA